MTTINQKLQMSIRENIKLNITIDGLGEIFNDALVTKITKTEVTFIIVEFTKLKEHIYEYTYKKDLIVGVGCSIASLDNKFNEEDDDDGILFLL